MDGSTKASSDPAGAGDVGDSARTVYEGRVVTLVLNDAVGADGQRHRREIVQHADAAAVLAVDDQDRVLLVRQHRPAVGRDMLELPAGLVDVGEAPAECALRELREETGLTAERVELLASYYSSAGFCTERIWVYLAHGLKAGGGQHLDAGEELDVLWESLDALRARIRRAELADAKTLVGLLAYLDRRASAGDRAWAHPLAPGPVKHVHTPLACFCWTGSTCSAHLQR